MAGSGSGGRTPQLRKLGIVPGALVRDTAITHHHLVDTKVAAIDQDWSALKFVWRKELREMPRG